MTESNPRMVRWHPSRQQMIILWFHWYISSLHAELWGLYHGLSLAWDKGYRNVTCYSDSQFAISLVKESSSIFHKYASLIHSVQALLNKNWSVTLLHTLMEGNQCADFLTKKGALQEDGLKMLATTPMGISSLLLADSCGVAFQMM